MKQVEVVGAVIREVTGEILCAKRSQHMSLPGLWEFPGGKVEAGEDHRVALRREIQEELGCEIQVLDLVADVIHEYPTVRVRLATYEAIVTAGEPIAHEHEELRWVTADHLVTLAWSPADVPTVRLLVGLETPAPNHLWPK